MPKKEIFSQDEKTFKMLGFFAAQNYKCWLNMECKNTETF